MIHRQETFLSVRDWTSCQCALKGKIVLCKNLMDFFGADEQNAIHYF